MTSEISTNAGSWLNATDCKQRLRVSMLVFGDNTRAQLHSAKTLSIFLASQCPYSCLGNMKRHLFHAWNGLWRQLEAAGYPSVFPFTGANCLPRKLLQNRSPTASAWRSQQGSESCTLFPSTWWAKLTHQRSAQAEALDGTLPSPTLGNS